MSEQPLQNSLFEDDYLLRELGQVAHVPQVALTELVANAWDAGASRVDLVLPTEIGGILTVTDDGHGMTPEQFKKRWMTLRYTREKYQGFNVEFPTGRAARPRKAYGRNGIGRHGLLCFADEYEVKTWRDGILATFVVGTGAGSSPFVCRSETEEKHIGSGTRLQVQVTRKLPDADEILTVLSSRFIHDPEFEVRVNGKLRPFTEIDGRISEETLYLSAGRHAKVVVIDSTRLNHSSLHQGIAFWVQHRLVGTPSWAVGQIANFDGRTRFARRYKVIVDTEGFESDVEQDWTAFCPTDSVNELYQATAEHIHDVAQRLAVEFTEITSEDALVQNRSELATLGQGARLGVAEFTTAVAQEHPTVSPEFLATAVKALIQLEKTKSGAALLEKLATLQHDDIEGLDRLLAEWTVKDALRVLDEIDSRLSVVETIQRLADDPDTDELHTLHPLILRSRWLFGPEFESQEYCSNMTLQSVARELFKSPDAQFINERNRPDIVVLPENTTWQMTGIESFDPVDVSLVQMQQVLVIELKKGGFELTRKEVNQADGYVQDIAASGLITGTPFINAWVVGQKVAAGVAREKVVGDGEHNPYGRVRATTFGSLVGTANARLMKLRHVLADRYENTSTDDLINRVLCQPVQSGLKFK
ncbi:TPA: ATP-binding protein [Klebsiella aerogenes]